MVRRQGVARTVLASLLLTILLTLPAQSDIYVVCDPLSGEVVLEALVDESRHLVMEGPLPGERTATIWLDENCPDRLCTDDGACGTRAPSSQATSGSSWLVVCNPSSGSVGMVQAPPPSGFLLLPGSDGSARQHSDREAARSWAEEQCSSWRCDADGSCLVTEGTVRGGGSGWVAGALTSESLDSSGGLKRSKTPTISSRGPSGSVAGPPAADLSPLINSTKAAAGGCGYPAALASVDQIANFDPEHPFYAANRDKIWRLAERQRQTEQTVWQASAALQAGDWNRARDLSYAAANIAVSCQAPAVSSLLGGIDTAIKQIQEQKRLKRQKTASRLLPGLVSLSNALIGAQSGVPVDVEALMAEIAPSVGVDLPLGALEPCAFKYEYSNASAVEPTCSCSGYRFDPGQFRCVK